MDHLSQLQRSLEDMKELFSSRMSAFESASKTSQTEDLGIVEEYHAFKVFIWNAVESLQAQMGLVHKTLEQMEMRSDPQFFSCMVFRRQTLRMPLPLFACQRFRNAVWASKKHLKGSGYTLSEFLTSARHAVFVEARRIFGVERSWTSDGRIMVLGQDKTRYRITSLDELRAIPQTRLRGFVQLRTGNDSREKLGRSTLASRAVCRVSIVAARGGGEGERNRIYLHTDLVGRCFQPKLVPCWREWKHRDVSQSPHQHSPVRDAARPRSSKLLHRFTRLAASLCCLMAAILCVQSYLIVVSHRSSMHVQKTIRPIGLGIVSVSDGNLEFASARENWRVLLAHYAGPAALLVVAALLAPALPLA
ncbi:hypothetical protein MSG28_004393, partial [Choristoneura fumiferana]